MQAEEGLYGRDRILPRCISGACEGHLGSPRANGVIFRMTSDYWFSLCKLPGLRRVITRAGASSNFLVGTRMRRACRGCYTNVQLLGLTPCEKKELVNLRVGQLEYFLLGGCLDQGSWPLSYFVNNWLEKSFT